jgi:hypothetical protein
MPNNKLQHWLNTLTILIRNAVDCLNSIKQAMKALEDALKAQETMIKRMEATAHGIELLLKKLERKNGDSNKR